MEKFGLIFDPEDPDISLGFGDENENLFAVELSQIDVNQSVSEVVAKNLPSSSFMDFEVAPEVSAANAVGDMRVPCDFCGRKFNPDVSLKHVPICQRNYEKRYGPVRRGTVFAKKSQPM